MKKLTLNFKIIIFTLALYTYNQITKKHIDIEPIKWFMNCYFNDLIGGITFTAYVNYIAILYNKCLKKLWHIELLLLCCGIFWEYATPLIRPNVTCDNWDIVAYMIGGFLYWLIMLILEKEY